LIFNRSGFETKVGAKTNLVKPFTNLAIILFSLIALLHVLRFFGGWEVIIHGVVIPMWASFVGFIIAGGLAVMVWRESQQGKR